MHITRIIYGVNQLPPVVMQMLGLRGGGRLLQTPVQQMIEKIDSEVWFTSGWEPGLQGV